MKKFLSLLAFLCTVSVVALAQDTLPKFNVKNIGNKHIIISWRNNYDVVKQISIQRSPDSLRNFKTILSVADPTSKENGYADTKAPSGNLFYRLFIVLDNGGFVFTEARRPVFDSLIVAKSKPEAAKVSTPQTPQPTAQQQPEEASLNLKKDNNKTEKLDFGGTTPAITNKEINNKPNPNVFVPSLHVYTYKDGNVRINLPETDEKKYSIKFFDETDSFVFEIKEIKQTPVLLDKANFYHAGWFKFELYENGKLIEKNKFKIAKDF
ncbi:MAG: hypothetical protein JST09_16225 [Bacteroidetes bacterium]|nr:hypothetical protein [Bacteroidota bacterium]